MARALFADIISDSSGNRIAGASVTVRNAGTSTPYAGTLYAAPGGVATLTNPLIANAQGFVYFYTDTATTVDLYVTASGYNPITVAGVATTVPSESIDGAVLIDGSVGTAELADGAVTSAKIADGTVATGDLADDAVTAPKLAAGAVGASEIADGSITDVEIAAANKDGTAGTPSLRTLGTGAAQACAGNDSRLSDSRTPLAHALSGAAHTGAATLSQLPNIIQIGEAHGSTGSPTTGSASFSDLTDLSVTLTTQGGDLVAIACVALDNTTIGQSVQTRLILDGATVNGTSYIDAKVANYSDFVTVMGRWTPSAGSHTVKCQWATGGGTARSISTHRHLYVFELRKVGA